MPRYAYQTPRARVYAYNYGYMNNYYKPLTYYVERETRAPSEQPGHQSLAELRRQPPVWYRHPWDWDCLWIPPHETHVTPHFGVGSSHDLILRYYSLRPRRHWSLDDYRPTYTRHYLLRDFDQGVGLSLGHRLCPFHDAEIPRSVTALEAKKDLLALERKKEFTSIEKSVEVESTKEAVEKKESLKAIAY